MRDETHMVIYAQPGKHTFSPIRDWFELLPNVEEACSETMAGDGRLLVNELFQHAFTTNDTIDWQVRQYLKTHVFVPSLQFEYFDINQELMTTWEQLAEEIPTRIHGWIERLATEYPKFGQS
ncbi:hypothetical protein [Paenibacillus campi]|uniref:hypothetical protein n=1 Tax=Paenibacillus campi TaxID=3106031 RepID=UPI002AFDCE1F|nr:hypothetical protein [Paenibacillus sp. SGZ-1009]